MNKSIKILIGVVILIVAFILVRAIQKPTSEEEHQKVVYGISPFQDTILPIVAEKQNWYKKENLDVDLRVLDWGDVMPAVAAGSVDVAIQNFNSFQATYENIKAGGVDIIFYYPLYVFKGAAIMIRSDSKLKPLSEFLKQYPDNREQAVVETVRQLKGKTILVTKGTEMEQIVIAAMKKGGLQDDDVRIIHAQPSDSLAGFLRGEADGFSGGLTERIEASRHGAVALVEASDVTAPVIDGLVTTEQFARKHPDILAKLIKLWLRTINFMEEDMENRAPIVTEYLGRIGSTKYSTEEYKFALENMHILLPSVTEIENTILNSESNLYWKKSWDFNNDFLLGEGKIKSPIPYDAFWGERVAKILGE